MSDAPVNVLIVDDRPEKLLSLEAVLEGLDLNLVRAESGGDALRQLLRHEFAVILLDVNMPAMDGFETAQLIRQRRNCADVPIIFLTAMGDEMHQHRSYSLGAVDYILTPVVPQILRSKVSVFVDLYRKTRQVRLQADRLRQRATQLHQLTTASIDINSATSIDKILQVTTETALAIIDAHQAVTLVSPGPTPMKKTVIACYSARYAGWNGAPRYAENPALLGLLNSASKPLRMVQSELETQAPVQRGALDGPPPRGLLSAPLHGRNARRLATIFLSEKADGEFTDDDQAILMQLAQMASIAIENTLYAAEREDNRLKEEFLSTLSHELRTPLSAMSGWVQLLRREALGGEIAHGLDVIERNVNAQSRLIEDLLDLSQISTGKLRLKPRPVSPRQILEAALEAMRPVIAERKLNLACELNGDNPTVMGDADRLQQVFWNLLSNSAKFTPAGGTIIVQMHSGGGQLKVVVRDNGQGIDADFLPHVFSKFRQADGAITRRHGGLGIGLTIVKHLIEQHGGMVIAESPGKGCGSTFTVTLPEVAAEQKPAPAAADRGNGEMPSLEGMSVLVVDDHADALEVVSEILRRQNATVATAASARQALDSLAGARPDVLVTDLGMPDCDGYGLLREVRRLTGENGNRLPVIALTAHARPEDRHQSLEAGFQAHLPKPVDPHDLVAAVHQFGLGLPAAAHAE